ncbi:hypothetical protein PHYPSEUDO_000939 [Phytophthora pseudosyringae]|uniref:Uncharacterized protein n=1 Tax=Phytophthora pseudosyringae TaxID=221518 RepID=A0A8T1VX19_9STRA|nr:hypothetical protein PHYPSEUDO_000939 [Phytophthora pseudosyringae]
MTIYCDYYPVSQRKFSHKSRKETHITKEHQRPGRLLCRDCTKGTMRLFATSNSLRTHQCNHELVACGISECTVLVTRSNLARHRAKYTAKAASAIPSSTAGTNTDATSNHDGQAPFVAKKVYQPPKDDASLRAPGAAPNLSSFQRIQLKLLKWYKDPISLRSILRGKNSSDHTAKFLTKLEKMGVCFELTHDEIRNKRNGQ